MSNFEFLREAPPNWGSVYEFAQWVLSKNLPLCPMVGLEVIDTDDATAFPIYRHKNFQAELYVFRPSTVPAHSHPYVEVAQSRMSPEIGRWTDIKKVLSYPATHGGADFVPDPTMRDKVGLLMTFQKWPEGTTPSTLAAAWKGPLMGPKQEALVRRFFPNAYIESGYADITKVAETCHTPS